MPPPPLIPIEDDKEEEGGNYQSNPLYPSIPQLPSDVFKPHEQPEQIEELPRKERKPTVKKELPPVELHKSDMKNVH